jgi:hypothetical protein
MKALHLLGSLVAGVALAAGVTLLVPGIASADTLRGPTQVDCTVYPYGYPGCEEHLGQVMKSWMPKSDLRYVSDFNLGRAAMDLCEVGYIRNAPLVGAGVPNTLKYNVNMIAIAKNAVPRACG